MARISVSANEEVIATGIGTTTVSNGRFVRIVNTTGATDSKHGQIVFG